MSRPTDQVRGARIALDIAELKYLQPELLDDPLEPEFWLTIRERAQDVLDEHAALVAAQRAGS